MSVDRLPDLVPIRYARMLESPFAFFRGSAAMMAAGLAGTPRSGIDVQLCGDAHLANFGGYGSPEHALAGRARRVSRSAMTSQVIAAAMRRR